VPGGIATRHELRWSMLMIAGYLFTSAVPNRKADDVFDWLARNRRVKFQARLDQDPITKRMKTLLGDRCSAADIRASIEHNHDWRIEDFWARLQASHKSDRQIRTEVVGLEHLGEATEQGQGVVFWGMSFCGTLFSKIALSRAGVQLTQLSAADHGGWFPLTLLGKWIAGPLFCLPENRYLSERIRIPVDGSNRYLYRLGEVLKKNGCIWIAGERTRAKRLVCADVLGREGQFPVGAPLLALRHNATLLPTHTERVARLHYRVTIEAPIPMDRSMRRNEIIDQAVQDYARRLTAQILKTPGDFEWNHLWAKSLASNQASH